MNAFWIFAFVASITPGPTNILIFTNGGRHGFLATLPLIIGSAAGAAALVWITGAGLAGAVLTHPTIRLILLLGGVLWLSVLAGKLYANAAVDLHSPQPTDAPRRQGALVGASLQLINPKTWMMALSVISVFLPRLGLTGWDGSARLALTFCAIALACLSAWGLLGAQSARILPRPEHMKYMNRCMAILLLVSVWSSALM